MKFLKWLYPGMRVKRWILLMCLGLFLAVSGTVMTWTLGTILRFQYFILIPLRKLLDYPLSPQAFGIVEIIIGMTCLVIGLREVNRSIIAVLMPRRRESDLVDIIFQKRQLAKGPKIVAIGGGTGLSTLLHGLKEFTSNITAIVTVADDGGSSGRLRQEFGVAPPGDIRNCIVALADSEPLMAKLFQHRFKKGHGLEGHNFGNLFITTMSEILGDFEEAVKESSAVLAVRGRVLPSTLQDVVLGAELEDGSIVMGESKIPESGKAIKRIFLRPAEVKALPEAIEAILNADAIVLGPGSLYTSIISNLLIDEIVQAIRRSPAVKIYVCNIMTQRGETKGYTAYDHVKTVLDYLGDRQLDYTIVNNERITKFLALKYQAEGAHQVKVNVDKIPVLKVEPIVDKLVSKTDVVRHNSIKLAELVIKIVSRRMGTGKQRITLFGRRFQDNLDKFKVVKG